MWTHPTHPTACPRRRHQAVGFSTWLDLVPWRCSCRGTQRQLSYGSSPGVSVLGKMNRVVYSQAHVSTVAPDHIEPFFLWSPSSSLAVYMPVQCQLWIAILSHSAHVAKVSKSSLLNPTWISWLSFSLSKMSSFLMWSLHYDYVNLHVTFLWYCKTRKYNLLAHIICCFHHIIYNMAITTDVLIIHVMNHVLIVKWVL